MVKRANLIISTLAISVFFVCAGMAHANWIHSYSKDDSLVNGYSVIRTSDNGYLVAGEIGWGSDEGALLLKLDDLGGFQWAKRYGDGNTYHFYTVLETSGQEYIAAGMLTHMSVASNGLIVKTDSTGNKLWEKEYPGINGIRDIKQTSDGGYIVGGYQATSIPNYRGYVALKLDSNLNPVWRTDIPISSMYCKKYPIHETTDGGYIFADSARIIKLNPDGSIDWQKRYNDDAISASIGHIFSIYPTSDGNFIVCGQWAQTFSSLFDGGYFVLKIDSLGNPLWAKAYEKAGGNEDGNQWALSIIEASNGDLIVGGENQYWPTKISMLRLDPNGNIRWQKEYGAGPDRTELLGLVSEIEGNIFAIGSRQPDVSVGLFKELLLMNLNSSGETGNDCDFITDTLLETIDISVSAYDTAVEPDRTLYDPVDVVVPVEGTSLDTTVICEGLPVSLKLPLPAEKSWLLTVEAGGKTLWGGEPDKYHTDDYGYFSLDFDDLTEEDGQLTDVSVLAAGSGEVKESGYKTGWGYTVTIDHDFPYDGTGYVTRYAHMQEDSLLVEKGDWVHQGQKIGIIGNTGWSNGSHLHFQVNFNGSSKSWVKALQWVLIEGLKIEEYKVGTTSEYEYYFSTNKEFKIDIKANGSDEPINIVQGENLSVIIELTRGSSDGVDADWWVLATTPFGWYHYHINGRWYYGESVTYQGSLYDLIPFEVFNSPDLQEGTYTFYFGVDEKMNGVADYPLYYDSAEVNITP